MRKSNQIFSGALVAAAFATGSAVAAPTVVELTQVACQFVESENGVDHDFKTTQKADCEAINAKNAENRLQEAKPLQLKAGDYVFKVTNKDVPYMLGFWLRNKGYNPLNPVDKLTGTSVSGGGLNPGVTLDYDVTLKPGEYGYSCPMTTTSEYRMLAHG